MTHPCRRPAWRWNSAPAALTRDLRPPAQEEEYLTNNLQRTISALTREKARSAGDSCPFARTSLPGTPFHPAPRATSQPQVQLERALEVEHEHSVRELQKQARPRLGARSFLSLFPLLCRDASLNDAAALPTQHLADRVCPHASGPPALPPPSLKCVHSPLNNAVQRARL